MRTRNVVSIKIEDIEAMGRECAWQGCDNRFLGEMPIGWINLLTWWSPWPEPELTIAEVAFEPACQRDAALCPAHAAELEAQLKDIGNALKDVAGSA